MTRANLDNKKSDFFKQVSNHLWVTETDLFVPKSIRIHISVHSYPLERFSYDLATKTREQNRNNKRTEIERSDWFIERIQTSERAWLLVGYANALVKKLHARKLSRNQSILGIVRLANRVAVWHQRNLHISVFFGGKTKSPCFDLFIHCWQNKQRTLTETIFQGHTKIALFPSFVHT